MRKKAAEKWTAAEAKQRVIETIEEQLGVDADEITRDSSFRDDLGADSLDDVELVMALEEVFGIEIPDEDAEKLLTVGMVIDYVTKRVA